MAHGLELRSPWLDYRIVEWAAELPDNLKLKKNISKKILKRYMLKKFPSKIVNRPKQGFSIPIHDWIRGPLRPIADDLFSTKSINELGYLNSCEIQKLYIKHQKKAIWF